MITARGGSKRLPGKNLRLLHGQPLISWTIEAALKSQYIDRVVVTSDDIDILAVAQKEGVEVVQRPSELAQDDTTSFCVVKHAIEQSPGYDYVILLQPTSPLRDATDIDAAINRLFEMQAKAVISVCKAEHNPLWANQLPVDGSMKGFLGQSVVNKCSQDLGVFYRLNGAIYIAMTKALLEQRTFFLQDDIYSFIMEQNKSIDIDTIDDFLMAEFLLRQSIDNKDYLG